MLKKNWLFIIVLSFNTVLYSQEFETKLNLLWPGFYIDGNPMPVEVTIKITLEDNSPALSNTLVITGSLKEHDIVKFAVTDANGNSIGERFCRHADPNFFESRMYGNNEVGNFIDLHDWFELDKEGLYFVSAKWQFSTDNGKTYAGQTDKKPFRIISAQGRKIYELTWQTMTMSQLAWEGMRPSALELVTLGEPAIPYILLWLEDFHDNMPWINEVSTSPREKTSLLEVMSQIGSEQGRKIIAEANNIDDAQRKYYLEKINIWQSPDRYNELVAKLSTNDTKWAIYKLGILGDSRAIPALEQVAQQHESLDIRETAKDAVAHLKDSSIPMYYRRHDLSEKIVMSSPKTTYKLGEPIEIRCKLIAGPYGSHKLTQFSKPAYHFLPWGISSEPYRIQMMSDIRGGRGMPGTMPPMLPGIPMPGTIKNEPPPPGINKYGMVIPFKELQTAQRYLADQKQEPLSGYVSVDILGTREPLTLGPNEIREYTLSDSNERFHLNTPGQYKIYVGILLFKAGIPSNEITIKIHDPNSQ